jgi:hypothetical protein
MAGNGPNLGQGTLTSFRPKLLKAAALPTSEASQYAAPAGQSVEIKSASVTNTTGGALTVTLSVVPGGGAAAAGNRVYSALSIAAGATTKLDALIGTWISDTDFISGVASGAGVSLVLTGIVYGG